MTKRALRDEAREASDGELKHPIDLHDEKVSLLQAEHERTEKHHEELNKRRKQEAATTVDDNDIIEINAGGVPIAAVARGALAQIKGSSLEALFGDRWDDKSLRDSKGRIFLDINPVCFQSIVDCLSEREIAPPESPPSCPSHVNKEDQRCLDQLMTTLGIVETLHTESDTTTLNDPKHIQVLCDFLSEDETHGKLGLLCGGSRDGFGESDVHLKCDNRGPTVTIVKDVGGCLFGGFVNTSWGTGGTVGFCDKAFLFSLHSHADLGPTKMRIHPGKTRAAICNNNSCGPLFDWCT